MRGRCGWCGAAEGLALVGISEAGSGPGGTQHACRSCRDAHGILTVAEHPPGSLGGVRYRPRRSGAGVDVRQFVAGQRERGR